MEKDTRNTTVASMSLMCDKKCKIQTWSLYVKQVGIVELFVLSWWSSLDFEIWPFFVSLWGKIFLCGGEAIGGMMNPKHGNSCGLSMHISSTRFSWYHSFIQANEDRPVQLV